MKSNEEKYSRLKEYDKLRMFRNKLVHKPTGITNEEIRKNIQILKHLKNEY